jgi:imidazolonepropionase-like amidohydrolase
MNSIRRRNQNPLPTLPLGGGGLVAVALAIVCAVVVRAEAPDTPTPLAFHVAKVVALDDANTVVNDAVVVVRDGRIEACGPANTTPIPTDCRVYEFPEHWLVPGIVEAHDHAAAGGWGDLNDMVYQTNPGLDSRSIPRPDNDWMKRARMGGVTTVLLLPGSGTNIAGFGTVVSTAGHNPDEITLRTPGSLKVAQAGNPEWYFGGNGRSFMNWNTRQTIEKARDYCRRWDDYEQAQARGANPGPAPEYDPIWHGFRPVFHGDIPTTVHTQIYQVQMTTIDMFAEKFGLWTVTEHGCFDGWKVAPLVREAEQHPRSRGGVWTIQGPRQYHFDSASRRMLGNADGWWKNGVRQLGINTDAPVVPQEELTYQAAMACWYGWLPYPALRGITNITAKTIGMYGQVGSVEPHKRADLSIWTGDPLDPRSACLMTIVNGKIAYDGTHGVRRF